MQARTVPDANNPLGFFTTVADKMLRSTFPFGITNIPVCSNGVYVYTPAVQRLLQLSANIYDAGNTNFFPAVFRPLFANDAASNLFIIGYQQVTNVSGPTDPQLSPPYDVAQLSVFNVTPIADACGPVNIYGVPWIIGAKKGLPNFNQLSLVTAATFTRKLQVMRTTIDPSTAVYATNQMYVMSISNNLGITFWNSYNADYPRPLTIYVHDVVTEALTNSTLPVWSVRFDINGAMENAWPGSKWGGVAPNVSPQPASFVNANWSVNYLPDSICYVAQNTPLAFPLNTWTSPGLAQFPQVGLVITNRLQAFILDGNNVIDYVQLRDPVTSGGLNQALADPDYPDGTRSHYQWSTNAYPVAPAGVMNQLDVSGHPGDAPQGNGTWSTASTVIPGDTTPPAEAAFFNGFFLPKFIYKGVTYVNSQYVIQAPYTPTRTVFSAYLLQANDPLVHYMASDLNSQNGTLAVWGGKNALINGFWYNTDHQPMPTPPTTPIGGHYQPWLQSGQMNGVPNVIPVTNNYAVKDPLVWGSDNWDFPTNLLVSLNGLGRVHRGTPWQTVYLKSTDVLKESTGWENIGTNTWIAWTGDFDANDAVLMAPVADWRLAGLLMSLLNTNDPTQLFSVNDPNFADWQNVLNGLTVYSNSAANPNPSFAPTFDTYVMAGNSPQASVIANEILQTKANCHNGNFYSIGDICATPELSQNSPFLNFGIQQASYGIADWEYEAISAQLLPLLRPDSIGTLTATNGGWNLSFSGADGYAYVVQSSTNLNDWINLTTNYPVQGNFDTGIGLATNKFNGFYRSVLFP